MKRIVLLMFWHFGLLGAGRLLADVVILKDGRQISGRVESGNTQELHIRVGDQSQTVDINQLRAIQFDGSPPAPATGPNQADGRGRNGLALEAATPLLGRFVCLVAAAWNGRKASGWSRT